MIIYSTKTQLGRSIDKGPHTVLRMLRDGRVEEVYIERSSGRQELIGYVLTEKLSKPSVQEVQ